MKNITRANCTNISIKKDRKIKITAILIVAYIFFVNCSVFCLGAEDTHIIGDDPIKTDLRNFDAEWLADEFDDTDWDDLDEGLNEIYNGLYNHWDDRKANDLLYDNTGQTYYNPDCLKKYSKNDFVDIVQLRVEDLDEDTAKMVVQVAGDADSADKIWFLFIWSDCVGDDDDDLTIIAYFVPVDEDLGGTGEDYSFYEWNQGDTNGNGTLDFDNAGHNIEMDFDSENWENVKLCNVRAMMLTTADVQYELLEETDMITDIFPGVEKENQFMWWWILLIILIAIVAVIVIYLLIRRKNRKDSKKGTKKRFNF